MDHKENVYDHKVKVARLVDQYVFGAPEEAPISEGAAKITDELTLLMYAVCGDFASDLTARMFTNNK